MAGADRPSRRVCGDTVITIDAFDAAAATDDELRALWEFACAIEREVEPDDPSMPLDVFMTSSRIVPSYVHRQHWLARDASDIVGVGYMSARFVETNKHLAFLDVSVRADRRREGIARRLLGPIASATTALGRTLQGAEASEGGAGESFLAATGAEKRAVERRSRLSLSGVDVSMLDAWVMRAKERASDYSLLFWPDKCPDDLRDQYVKHMEVMNTAPRDDLDMEDWLRSPERYDEDWQHNIAMGEHAWTMCVRHDPTGELAGFTELWWFDWMGDLAWQGNTGVDPAHRNKGLGRWLKAAMLQKVLRERPELSRVDTWNAGSNEPMLAINVALGFRPVKHYGDWQVPTDTLAAYAAG